MHVPREGTLFSWVGNYIVAEITFQLHSTPSWDGHWQAPALSVSVLSSEDLLYTPAEYWVPLGLRCPCSLWGHCCGDKGPRLSLLMTEDSLEAGKVILCT